MAAGTFVWNELLTRDVEGAKAFYTNLLGWQYRPMTDGGYWVAELNGRPVAGIMHMPAHLPDTVPPHWFEYVQVDDVDASLALATKHGGKIYRAPFDVPGVGRIGFMVDATGAPLGLMTPSAPT